MKYIIEFDDFLSHWLNSLMMLRAKVRVRVKVAEAEAVATEASID